jgi:hypothetical protein
MVNCDIHYESGACAGNIVFILAAMFTDPVNKLYRATFFAFINNMSHRDKSVS